MPCNLWNGYILKITINKFYVLWNWVISVQSMFMVESATTLYGANSVTAWIQVRVESSGGIVCACAICRAWFLCVMSKCRCDCDVYHIPGLVFIGLGYMMRVLWMGVASVEWGFYYYYHYCYCYCVESREFGAPRLPGFILLGSFSGALLVVSILDIVYDCHL